MKNIRLNPILSLAVVFGVAVIAVIVLWAKTFDRTATLVVRVAPASATIRIGNRTVQNGTHKFKPGRYSVLISKTGFDDYVDMITLFDNETYELLATLSQLGGGVDWFAEHPEEDIIMNGIGSEQFIRSGEQAVEQNPILAYLPYTDPGDTGNRFRIYAIATGATTIQVKADLYTCALEVARDYKQIVIDWIRERGFNPDELDLGIVTLCGEVL